MKIFFGARLARWDLLHAVRDLTRYITKWTQAHDKMLYRVVAYIQETKELHMKGHILDSADDHWLGLYVDADHGGGRIRPQPCDAPRYVAVAPAR